mmetsp:Transcript_38596/g.86999  ORF Transcript_38596/g.86999 Transcript_38596/m.86999 type:complete len:184 (-) Transcript_38596:140-691(-)
MRPSRWQVRRALTTKATASSELSRRGGGRRSVSTRRARVRWDGRRRPRRRAFPTTRYRQSGVIPEDAGEDNQEFQSQFAEPNDASRVRPTARSTDDDVCSVGRCWCASFYTKCTIYKRDCSSVTGTKAMSCLVVWIIRIRNMHAIIRCQQELMGVSKAGYGIILHRKSIVHNHCTTPAELRLD